jgi:hypothetical protein
MASIDAKTSRVEKSLFAKLSGRVPLGTVLFVLGVLVIQLAFITSYIGAFHNPVPHHVAVEIVAPRELSVKVAARLDAIPGGPLRASAATGQAAAFAALRENVTAAVFVPGLAKSDTLFIASAAGAAQAEAVENIFQDLEAATGRRLAIRDLVPFQTGDGRGLSAFYLVVGWLIGGYLLAALFGLTHGRPASWRRAAGRLLATVPYAVASGIGGAVIIGPVLGAINGHFAAVAGVGTLLVLAAAATAMALQGLLGTAGIGVILLLFVVLGNPSAGGPYQASLLPPFWRAIGGVLPNGAGLTAVRQISYFGGYGIAEPLVIVGIWILAGTALTLAAGALSRRAEPNGKMP